MKDPNQKTWKSALVLLMSLMLVLTGCVRQTPPQIKLPQYSPTPLKPPIEERAGIELPPKKGAPVPLLKCTPPAVCTVAFDGILIDEHLAAKFRLQQAERDTLRTLVQTDRSAFQATHKVYETAINDLAERSHRSWWDANKGTVGFWAGVVVGMATTILTVYGVSRAEKSAE